MDARVRPFCAGRSTGKRRRDLRNNKDISVLGLHDTDGTHTLGGLGALLGFHPAPPAPHAPQPFNVHVQPRECQGH